jgi:hypothetical protein
MPTWASYRSLRRTYDNDVSVIGEAMRGDLLLSEWTPPSKWRISIFVPKLRGLCWESYWESYPLVDDTLSGDVCSL